MLRPISIALLAGVMLISFAALPAMLPSSTTLALSGSALAQKVPETNAKNLNSSRSNVNRMGGGAGKSTKRTGKTNDPAASRAINLNSSRSNRRATNLNSSRSNTRGINLNPFMLIIPEPE